MLKFIVAIDPGIEGAMAEFRIGDAYSPVIVDIHSVSVELAGKTKAGNSRTKSVYNLSALNQEFVNRLPWRDKTLFVIEESSPRPRDGGRQAFQVGYGAGILQAFCVAHGFPYELVTPSLWKRKMGLLGKDKKFSLNVARQMFPANQAELALEKHHNRAEALLLGLYWLRGGRQSDPVGQT